MAMTRRRIYYAVIGAVAVTVALAVRPTREPQVHGHPLSYWIQPWQSSRETPEAVAAAYAAMNDRHVRWLMKQMKWRPSSLRKLLTSMLNGVGLSVSVERFDDRREWAATALGRLGRRAAPAIPLLTETSITTVEPRGHQARMASRAALIQLGELSSQPTAEIVGNPNHPGWVEAADVMARLGTNYPEGPAIFAGLMFSSNAPAIRARATYLYGLMNPPLEEALPLFVRALDDRGTRVMALQRLMMLGERAAPTTQAVMQCLVDTNRSVRFLATNTLRSIAPDLAPVIFSP